MADVIITKGLEFKNNHFYLEKYRREPEPLEKVVLHAPGNLLRAYGGYLLPETIKWLLDEVSHELDEPRIAGVHVRVVFFGCTAVLRDMCDCLREKTVPEICVMVVGNEQDAQSACDKLKKLRFLPAAGSVVFRVTRPGRWPVGQPKRKQKKEWKKYVDWNVWIDTRRYISDQVTSERVRGRLPTKESAITYLVGYTSQSVLDSDWGKIMKLAEGVEKGVIKVVDTPEDASKMLDEETKHFKMWEEPEIREALDERDKCIAKGWDAAKKAGRVFSDDCTWDSPNENLWLQVLFQEKPVKDFSFWWAKSYKERMTHEVLNEIHNQLPWGNGSRRD
eukprot:jgi/Botrbrau1/6569/Bobra.40_2s0033.1